MNAKVIAGVGLSILLSMSPAWGQGKAADFKSSDISGPVIRAEVTHTGQSSIRAVTGISTPAPGWGYGGEFTGGLTGVRGIASVTGVGARTAVHGVAGNGTLNWGIRGNVSSEIPFADHRGAEGSGSCSGFECIVYGVFGSSSCSNMAGMGCTDYAVFASGDLAYTGTLSNPSDRKLKRNVAAFDSGTLDKLMELEVVTYEHTLAPEFEHMNLSEGQQVGFIAQQVEEVFPELVVDTAHPGKESLPGSDLFEPVEPIRYKGLKTIDMIPLLVKALQEQQSQIEALEAQLAPLRHRVAELEGEGEESMVVAEVN